MNEKHRLSWGRPAGALTVVMVLGLAGCGDGLGTSGKTVAAADKETPAAPPVVTKGRVNANLAPGGDQGLHERWNKKQKERAETK